MTHDGRRYCGAENRTTGICGHILVGHVEDGRLVLERRASVLRRVQARFSAAVPRDVSLAEELIAERREEARREAKEA